jgi:3-keto-disaccharide hydrolase
VRTRPCIILCLIAATLLGGCSSLKESSEAGFVPLFDGATFDGWEGNLEIFRIEDDAIVGGTLAEPIPHNDFLCTRRIHSDFELRLEVKLLGEQANAGIQFRSRRIPDHHEVIGYQADMGQQYWGCLYDESRRRKILAGVTREQAAEIVRAGDWNDYVIRCEGDRIQLWLNGTQTVDYTETDETIERMGIIGLQIHGGPPSEAWYRNIRIKRL